MTFFNHNLSFSDNGITNKIKYVGSQGRLNIPNLKSSDRSVEFTQTKK